MASSWLLTVESTERLALPVACAEPSSSSTGGARQVPLSEHFLAGLASADLRPEEVLESVHIPHSQKVRFTRPLLGAGSPFLTLNPVFTLKQRRKDVGPSHDFLFPRQQLQASPPGRQPRGGCRVLFQLWVRLLRPAVGPASSCSQTDSGTWRLGGPPTPPPATPTVHRR